MGRAGGAGAAMGTGTDAIGAEDGGAFEGGIDWVGAVKSVYQSGFERRSG